MLSHAIKKLLDGATGLKFSPVIGMSEQEPLCSYNLSDNDVEIVSTSTLEVRIQSKDYDEIEVLREKIKKLCSKENESAKSIDNYIIRMKPSGGGILFDGDYFDSTQFFIVKFYEKEKDNVRK
ncbi:hypothetical protein ACGCUP_00875 [Eubacteriales bacterium KG125]